MWGGNRVSMLKETLKNLCCSSEWCYGIFWEFDERNSLLLTLRDAYYDEEIGGLIDTMMQQVHVLGKGVIGQAAFAKKHRWMHSDGHQERQNALGSYGCLEVFQDDSEFGWQFSMGIKTVAVISVEPWGVVQLGSAQKIHERSGFVDQVKELLRGIGVSHVLDLQESRPSSSDCPFYDSRQQIDTKFACRVPCSAYQNFQEYTSAVPSQSFPTSSSPQRANSSFGSSSLIENQVQLWKEVFLDPGGLYNCAATQARSSDYDCSVITSSWPQLPDELGEKASFLDLSGYTSCSNSMVNLFHGQEFCQDKFRTQDSDTLLHDYKDERPSRVLTLDELLMQSAVAEVLLSNSCPGDEVCQLGTLLSNGISHAPGLVSLSDFIGKTSHTDISYNLPTNSSQSAVTGKFSNNMIPAPNGEHAGSNVGTSNSLFSKLGLDQILGAVTSISSSYPNSRFVNPSNSPPNGEHTGSNVGTCNSLFSKLGLDQILGAVTSISSSYPSSRFVDPSNSQAKRRKNEDYSWGNNQVTNEGTIPTFEGKKELLHPLFHNGNQNITDLKNEVAEHETDIYCPPVCVGSSSTSNKQEEPVKNEKKKAKVGTRPRPKDRQMIQDRLAELRELIPDGGKLSIDRLLERTIRHLNFMSNLTKHADSLKHLDKAKRETVQKGLTSNGAGGVTWACEVGEQTMVCPLIVEDLTTPGQLLIEILCEEHGFFLEIVEVVRGLGGVIILKGEMEVRGNKIWAHFVVQAKGNQQSTRLQVFTSLLKLLESTSITADTNSHRGNIISSCEPLFNNCQSPSSFPVNLADPLYVTNL